MNEKIKNSLESLGSRVIEKIRKENISMHSRLYFVIRSCMWILSTTFVFAVIVYLFSLLIFIFRSNALMELFCFGPRGWIVLISSMPWILILIVLILIVILEFLSSRFSFIYKRPLIYSLLGLIVLLVAGGSLLANTTLHHRATALSRDGRLPIAGNMYKNYTLRHHNDTHIGTVKSLDKNTFRINTRMGDAITVLMQDNTKIPRDFILKNGNQVMIIGKRNADTVNVDGICPIPRDRELLHYRDNKQQMK